MPRWLEFHDSELLSVTSTSAGTTLVLTGYVHDCHRESTGWRGAGWMQQVRLYFREPSSQLAHVASADIIDGTLEFASGTHRNLVPLPFASDTPVRLELRFDNGRALHIAGASVTFQPIGEPTFIEELPEDLRPTDAA